MFGSVGAGIFGMLAFLVAAAIGLGAVRVLDLDVDSRHHEQGPRDTEKIVWVIVVLFLPLLGALIYFFVGRPKASG